MGANYLRGKIIIIVIAADCSLIYSLFIEMWFHKKCSERGRWRKMLNDFTFQFVWGVNLNRKFNCKKKVWKIRSGVSAVSAGDLWVISSLFIRNVVEQKVCTELGRNGGIRHSGPNSSLLRQSEVLYGIGNNNAKMCSISNCHLL